MKIERKTKMANRVLITVEDGLIQEIHADDGSIDVIIVDWDGIKETKTDAELAETEILTAKLQEEMTEIY